MQREVERETIERLEHELAGDRQLVAQLGSLVQRTAQGDRVVLELESFFAQRVDRHGQIVGGGIIVVASGERSACHPSNATSPPPRLVARNRLSHTMTGSAAC